ncbi:hypothetical protein TVAG_178400 [Trichomonas vaginalis G3]|uniref:Uncharacterized protein n=1 Tax=Trichomonas vaginalis (strain ATCC PRA-98 / G3) TaxID=412133 RepID=A2DIJ2_TRIV3|nr:hypothetical protein TVAGG3_0602380 [Trichomonas vaginalis G3]EAY19796.1 hypothetical protein TVAG_178400 [Trichomonas vaginalis G3]KAI5524000.1 hypothetical protein TVAGG3_0602380 [Trichomonas vaginalis G3]|eukprot:XP_001580782.1 hypothetical protein [Trichomonas vaginalis G3]
MEEEFNLTYKSYDAKKNLLEHRAEEQKRLFSERCYAEGTSMFILNEKLKRIKVIQERLQELKGNKNLMPTEQEVRDALYRNKLEAEMISPDPELGVNQLIEDDLTTKIADEIRIPQLKNKIFELELKKKALMLLVDKILQQDQA